VAPCRNLEENEEQQVFECLPECEEDGDAKFIICVFGDGESLEDMPMREFDLINTSKVCECVGREEGRNNPIFVASEEENNSDTLVVFRKYFEG